MKSFASFVVKKTLAIRCFFRFYPVYLSLDSVLISDVLWVILTIGNATHKKSGSHPGFPPADRATDYTIIRLS